MGAEEIDAPIHENKPAWHYEQYNSMPAETPAYHKNPLARIAMPLRHHLSFLLPSFEEIPTSGRSVCSEHQLPLSKEGFLKVIISE